MGDTRFILAGSLIDGSGAKVRRNVFLAVKDGIITDIGPATALPRHDETAIDDLSHCTILPPLIDCSVSLSRSPAVDPRMRLATDEGDLAKKTAVLTQHIGYCHAHGVLGVGENDEITELLEHYRKKAIIDIRTSGGICRNSHDCAAASKSGGDFIKIGYSTDIDDLKSPRPNLNPNNLDRILQQKGGKKAVVVANGREQVTEALLAGCDAIEQGYGMGEDNLRAMAERNVLWIPNLLRAKNGLDSAGSGGSVCCRFSQRYVAPGKADPGAEAFWEKTLAEQMAQLSLALKLGVKTAIGTGAGSVGILHGESMVEEMKLFIKAGYTLEETIHCASESGAEFFGMEKLGTLTVGHHATFLVSRGSAQQLPRKLSYLEGIYIDGAPSATYSKNPVKKV